MRQVCVLAALALATTAIAASPPAMPPVTTPAGATEPPPEARIPFVNHGAVRNFRPVSDDMVYLQDRQRNWYRARLSGPCFNIRSALRIAVDTRPGGTLDNTSSFIVDGQRCPIESLVRSAEPPRRERR